VVSAPANDLFGPRALLRLAKPGRAHCKTIKGRVTRFAKTGAKTL
jgi:hypothetical protein